MKSSTKPTILSFNMRWEGLFVFRKDLSVLQSISSTNDLNLKSY